MTQIAKLSITTILGVFVSLYTSCRTPSEEGRLNETVIGSPVVEFSTSPFAEKGEKGLLRFCVNEIVLNRTEGQAPITVAQNKEVVVSAQGNVIFDAPIPSGTYSQATLKLKNSCSRGHSLQIENEAGRFSTSADLELAHSGSFIANTAMFRFDFKIQLLIDLLANVSSEQEIVTQINSYKSNFEVKKSGWRTMTSANAPSNRSRHTSVWTGNEMIVWGGTFDGTGGRYNPQLDQWQNTSMINAPTGRVRHAAVWTGSRMIVWGGRDASGNKLGNGGIYDPQNNLWASMSTVNAPTARENFTMVWTGRYAIVWGGVDATGETNTGGRYDVATNTWTALTTANAPIGRTEHTAVWNGRGMFVWGGTPDAGPYAIGKIYDPDLNVWTDTSPSSNFNGLVDFFSAFTGTSLVVWGGAWDGAWSSFGSVYNFESDTWTNINTARAPNARQRPIGTWTGKSLLIWGGADASTETLLGTGAEYFPANDSWTSITLENSLSARLRATSVWTGTEMIIWGGQDTNQFLNDGARFTP